MSPERAAEFLACRAMHALRRRTGPGRLREGRHFVHRHVAEWYNML